MSMIPSPTGAAAAEKEEAKRGSSVEGNIREGRTVALMQELQAHKP
jgi:hypothetical protein